MVVPPYCQTRAGRVFRVLRSSTSLDGDRMRYTLSAVPIKREPHDAGLTVSRDVDLALVRDKLANRQAIPTPEGTFEALFQQLRADLDARYDV